MMGEADHVAVGQCLQHVCTSAHGDLVCHHAWEVWEVRLKVGRPVVVQDLKGSISGLTSLDSVCRSSGMSGGVCEVAQRMCRSPGAIGAN